MFDITNINIKSVVFTSKEFRKIFLKKRASYQFTREKFEKTKRFAVAWWESWKYIKAARNILATIHRENI